MEKINLESKHSETLFLTLLEILKAENKSLKLLSANLKKQYDVLLKQQLANFFDVLEEQRALVWEMQQKEKMRQEELQKYLPEMENISLNEVIKIAPENYKAELEVEKNKFDLHVNDIENMKSCNQILIQKSLEMIQQHMSHFRGFEQKGYDATGKINKNDINIISKQV
jgi:hypothetical protein